MEEKSEGIKQGAPCPGCGAGHEDQDIGRVLDREIAQAINRARSKAGSKICSGALVVPLAMNLNSVFESIEASGESRYDATLLAFIQLLTAIRVDSLKVVKKS